ncbi:hypothetical protein [Mucilaginibacter paludis]|uniref:Uncharacterized protein n=1 Tax=Mucilaginibacter paludis DSM 18603 TaxID=714943 RepID=H1XZA8_9SPHI|nr:hypothetical protein [Mucilaginibacter paludis]EHQ25596.1 hypothetical protein Mucpa_1438 [Mucilaginibacter paludis DSM 18603]
MMINNANLIKEAKAWIKRKNAPDEIIRVVTDIEQKGAVISYELYTAFDDRPDYLGRILFDAQGYWIYDGEILKIGEQEQLAKFIMNYVKTL